MRVWISTTVMIPKLQTLHLIQKKSAYPVKIFLDPRKICSKSQLRIWESHSPTWPWIQATPVETQRWPDFPPFPTISHHFPPFPTPETRAPARPSTSHSGEWSWNLTGSSFRPPSCANFNPAHFFHQGTNDHRCRVFCNTPRLCESSMVFPQVYCQL